MIRVRIEHDSITPALQALSRKLGDLSPLMREASGIMADAVEENFAQEGRPRWKALAKSTIRRRQAKGYWPGKMLQQRGELAASVSRHHDRTSAAVGTNKAYAAIQHFGGTITQYARSQKVYFRQSKRTGEIGRRFVKKARSNFSQWSTRGDTRITLPARPFLTLTDGDQGEVLKAVERYLVRGGSGRP